MGYTALKSAGGVMEKSRGGVRFGTRYGDGFDNGVYNIFFYDGELYAVGSFTEYDGVTANRIVKLTYAGRIADSIFGTGFNNICYDMALQTTGKMVCCGAFSTYKGAAVSPLMRIATNGNKDSAYSISGWVSGISNGAICCASHPTSDDVVSGFHTIGSFNPVPAGPYYGVRTDSSGAFISSLFGTIYAAGFIPYMKYNINRIFYLPSGKILTIGVRYTNAFYNNPPIWLNPVNKVYLLGAGPSSPATLDFLSAMTTKVAVNCFVRSDGWFYLCGTSDGTTGLWLFNSSGGIESYFECVVDDYFVAVAEYNEKVYAFTSDGRLRKFGLDGTEEYVSNESYVNSTANRISFAQNANTRVFAAGAFTKYYKKTTGETAEELPYSRNRLIRFFPDKKNDKTLALRH